MVISGIVITVIIERWTKMQQIKSDVVNSRAVVGTAEMHGGTKKKGYDQLVCALFEKLDTRKLLR